MPGALLQEDLILTWKLPYAVEGMVITELAILSRRVDFGP